jgi:hypothetical protein
LNEWVTITKKVKLVEFPIKPTPIPFKPLLLDIAYDYVSEYPEQNKTPEKGGIMGVLSGLWK